MNSMRLRKKMAVSASVAALALAAAACDMDNGAGGDPAGDPLLDTPPAEQPTDPPPAG